MRHGNLLLLHYIYSYGMSPHGFGLTFVHVHTSQRAKPETSKMDSKMDSDQMAQGRSSMLDRALIADMRLRVQVT